MWTQSPRMTRETAGGGPWGPRKHHGPLGIHRPSGPRLLENHPFGGRELHAWYSPASKSLCH